MASRLDSSAPVVPPNVLEPPLHRSRRRLILIIVIVVVIIAVVAYVVADELLPSHSTSFSFTVTEVRSGEAWVGHYSFSFPSGHKVSGSWSTLAGIYADLTITPSGGSSVYFGDGPSGTFSFTAVAAPYFFNTTSGLLTNTTVSGSYLSS